MTGPPFDAWVPPPIVPEAPALPEGPDFQEILTLFVDDKKGKRF